MQPIDLDRKTGGRLIVDICGGCQAIWFDTYESLQLTPGATIELFRSIHRTQTESSAPRRALPARLACPRCDTSLALTQDIVAAAQEPAARITYYRCRYGHGRLTPFVQFLREKHFVRALDSRELERLKSSIRTIRCASCGAPVDIERSTVCTYCRAPILALDPQAVDKALRDLGAAEKQRVTPDPDKIGDAIIGLERLKRQMEQEQRRDAASPLTFDLVAMGFTALGAMLKWR